LDHRHAGADTHLQLRLHAAADSSTAAAIVECAKMWWPSHPDQRRCENVLG